MTFTPVSTLADLDTLDSDEMMAGYLDHRPDDPEPGPNRGRAYWHGWMNRARDRGEQPVTPEAAQLAREWAARERSKQP